MADPTNLGRHPAENIDWPTAYKTLLRHGMNLPTEVQWEYACRASTTTAWYWGPSTGDQLRHAFKNKLACPDPVGGKPPNPFGLHDTHTNVMEWCLDVAAHGSVKPRSGDGLREASPRERLRMVRGGGFGRPAMETRSSSRAVRFNPEHYNRDLGLRAVIRLL